MYKSYIKYENKIKELGISTYKVAKETGITSVAFTKWKNGISQPKYDKIKLIAEYIGTTPEYLLNEEETENENHPNNIKELKSLTEKKIIEDYRSLDDEGKKQLENFFDYLKNKYIKK